MGPNFLGLLGGMAFAMAGLFVAVGAGVAHAPLMWAGLATAAAGVVVMALATFGEG